MKAKLLKALSVLVVSSLCVAAGRRGAAELRARWNQSSIEYEKREIEKWKWELDKQLQKRVSFCFLDTPIVDAIAFLSNLTGANIVLDPAAVEGDDVPVTFQVNELRLGAALDWMMRLVNLTYHVRDEAIFVTAKCRGIVPRPVTYAYHLGSVVPPEEEEEFLEALRREIDDGQPLDPRAFVRVFGQTLVLHRMGEPGQGVEDLLEAMGIEPVEREDCW